MHVLVPRLGLCTHMSHFDVFLVWHVLTDVEVDISYIIINHMVRASVELKASLPYRHHLRKLFQLVGLVDLG
ncbi:hypothetical protein Syun_030060 [Stephania yunnanensis]|uniref:Uncharacterized protein n=1 Tax=Stephania yunnanensis TaxID=152371 RepID=A0AAP0E6S7_9MAGN